MTQETSQSEINRLKDENTRLQCVDDENKTIIQRQDRELQGLRDKVIFTSATN